MLQINTIYCDALSGNGNLASKGVTTSRNALTNGFSFHYYDVNLS